MTESLAHHRFDNAKRRREGGHDRQRMLTPSYILEPIRNVLGAIDLDPCTEADNPTRAGVFYSLPIDGRDQPWDFATIFCNPPYGEARNVWIKLAIAAAERGSKVVLLIPASTETQIAQEAMKKSTSVLFVASRVKFGVVRANGRQEAASHGSMIVGLNVDLEPINFLGTVFKAVKVMSKPDSPISESLNP